MHDKKDAAYFARRAEQELAMANCSEDNAAALAHLKLADAYTVKASALGGAPRASLAEEQRNADTRRGPTPGFASPGYPILRN